MAEFGYDIDAQEKADNEAYMNKNRALKVVAESTDAADVKSVEVKKSHLPNVHQLPKPKKVSELIKDKKPKNWLIEQIGAKGNLMLLAGESGSGKTSLCYSMADAVATGGLFLNTFQAKKQNVLFIQADESSSNCSEKLTTMAITSDIDFIFAEDGFNRLTVNDLNKFEHLLEGKNYGAVFLDSITTLLTGGKHTMKDAEFSAPLYFLNNIASKKNILIVFTCHLRKPEKGERKRVTKHDVMGSGAIFSSASDVWSLHKAIDSQLEDHYYFHCLKGRNCQDDAFYNLQGDDEAYKWYIHSAGDGQLTPDEERSCTAKVLKLFYEQDSALNVYQIANEVKFSEKQVRRVCRDLVLTNKLNRFEQIQGVGRPTWFYKHVI